MTYIAEANRLFIPQKIWIKEMMLMALAHLFIPPLLAATTFWAYMHSKIRKIDRPTAEIIGVFVLVIIGISIIWFLLSAPWFLNLGIAMLLMFKHRYLSGGF